MIIRLITLLMLATALSACNEADTSVTPKPVALTEDAVGHYCQMTVLHHPGPKAQVHLSGHENPLFFTQIRDAIAYQRMPEKSAAITAIYVNDMGTAKTWEHPGNTNWITAKSAFYVTGSSKRGGMGAPEIVPFALKSDAADFAGKHGGKVIGYTDITDQMVLSPVEIEIPKPVENTGHQQHKNHGSHEGQGSHGSHGSHGTHGKTSE